uniref:Uncharacterized protein n=1 Tax=Timema poppense TaxID=170557 RepID=A0A7R9GUK1_TIMPO|nr:unnamed protein product [Timema poppensis]
MDETTPKGTIKLCAFAIIYNEENHVRTTFFDMLGTSSGTAEDLFSSLIKILEKRGIPKENMKDKQANVFLFATKQLPPGHEFETIGI